MVVPVAALLTFAGCGGGKISRSRTEELLEKRANGSIEVRCRKGTYGWDYDCRYSYSYRGRRIPVEIGVDVDGTEIVNQSAP